MTPFAPRIPYIVVVTASAYSVGLDVETRHRLRILRRLGGGIWPAMAGKLLPYTILFLMVLGAADSVLFGILELPLRGHLASRIASGMSATRILWGQLLFVLRDKIRSAFDDQVRRR